MKNIKLLLGGLILAFSGLQAQVNDWENPAVFGIHKEKYHVAVIPYPDVATALQGDRAKSPFYKLLNGVWKLNYAKTPETTIPDFYKPEYDVSSWANVKVPGSLENQGFSEFIFTNIDHPFKPNIPLIPHEENPVASYRTSFSVPENWNRRQVFLNFDGVESAFYLWINGQKVGYSENSYCTAEFNITSYLKPGENTLAVQVFRFSDGSYLEDQDFWRLSGIFRDVYLYSTPGTVIQDFSIVTDLDANYRNADLKTVFKLKNYTIRNKNNYTLDVEVYDASRKLVASQSSNSVSFDKNDSATINLSQKLVSPQKWNTEHPYLYTLVTKLKDSNGKLVEVLSSKVGVREVEIKNGVLMVNGIRVIVRGVNRHEHDPYTGRYVTRESMIKDIVLMKQFNINAVRTCHYNNAPLWFELCDEYGLYLCAEANLESHFYWEKPSNNPDWKGCFMDRCYGLVKPYKNNPSVLYWSLGNESGFGPNHVAMSKWIHQNEPTRPVHYNPADRDSCVDIVAQMYPTPEEYIKYAQTEHRPVIICEYAHAMGNSCGNLKEYWDPTYSLPMAQGGFIWDWVDQGFFRKNEKGIEYIANSGELNDPKSQKFVGFDGMVLADRTVQPELYEYKYIIQPLKITAVDALNGKFTITNRYEATNLNSLEGRWELLENGKPVQQGTLQKLDVKAGEEKEFTVSFAKPSLRSGAEYFLNFSFSMPEAQLWAPKGHEVANEQIALPYQVPSKEFSWNKSDKSLKMDETPVDILVSGNDFTAKFNKTEGTLSSLVFQGKELIKQGPQLNLYRAPTDNDEMWFSPQSPAAQWRKLGLNKLKFAVQKISGSKTPSGVIEIVSNITVSSDTAGSLINNTLTYRIFPEGDIYMNNNIELLNDFNLIRKTGFPRIGFSMVLPEGLENYSWYGNGPFENYSDRNQASKTGIYQSTVEKQYFPYSRPQTTGNHTNIKWLGLSGADGIGLAVFGDPVIEASALHFGQNDLDKRSINDVTRQKDIFLDIDYRQRGLGGASCGPDVRDEYAVEITNYNFTVRFRPINLNQASPDDYLCGSPIVSAPVFSEKGKYLLQNEGVSILSGTPGAKIHYTLNGSEPSEASPLYSAPIKLQGNTTLKAKSFKDGFFASTTTSATYEIKKILLDYALPVKWNQPPVDVKLRIENVKQFGILITDPDNDNSQDHVDLAEARFIKKDGSVVYLCDIKPELAFQGWNELKKDTTCQGNPITMKGIKYKNSLGSHSYGELWYNLTDDMVEFRMLYGVDDETNGGGSSQVGLKIVGILNE